MSKTQQRHAFDYADPLMLEQQLSDDERQVRDAAQAYCQDRLAPRVLEAFRHEKMDVSIFREMGELGLLGATIDEQYGGAGLNYVCYGLIAREVERVDSGYRSMMSVQSSLVMTPINAFGTEAQKQKYLPKLCSGEFVGALAMSEPGAGSDVVGSMTCRAEQKGDHWIANGSKMWITNGPDADVLLVYMRTAHRPAGSRCMTAFLVEKGMKGFSTAQKLDKLGMRGSNTCELVFDNCEIPDANRVGEINEGVRVLMSGLDTERLVLSGGPIGLMQAALDIALPYVRERKQFNAPIGTFGIMQAKIADMYTALQSSRAYAYMVAQDYDRGVKSRIDPASCLLHASQSAVQVALDAIQALGGNGYINEYPTGRILRDAKLYEIGAGTNEIRRMLIGRELFHGKS